MSTAHRPRLGQRPFRVRARVMGAAAELVVATSLGTGVLGLHRGHGPTAGTAVFPPAAIAAVVVPTTAPRPTTTIVSTTIATVAPSTTSTTSARPVVIVHPARPNPASALFFLPELAPPIPVGLAQTAPDDVRKAIAAAWPPELRDTATAVATCESDLNPLSVGVNQNLSIDYGLFQINDGIDGRFSTLAGVGGTPQLALDVRWNALAAYSLYLQRGWEPWSCARKLQLDLSPPAPGTYPPVPYPLPPDAVAPTTSSTTTTTVRPTTTATTLAPTTTTQTTVATTTPTTVATTTSTVTTTAPTTVAPTTTATAGAPTTVTTVAPTTVAPATTATTVAPTTAPETTIVAVTTVAPTTAPATTAPTTTGPTTAGPTTAA